MGAAITDKHEKGLLVLIEPDPSVRDALSMLLCGEGWAIRYAEDCRELERIIDQQGGAAGGAAGGAWGDVADAQGALTAVISESSLPKCTPGEILELSSSRGLPVVFTGHQLSLQGAVDLIRQGAVDFLDKPFPQSRLLDLLDRLAKRQNG